MAHFIKFYSKHLIFGSIAVTGVVHFGKNNNIFAQQEQKAISNKRQEEYYTVDEVRKYDGSSGKPTFVTFRGGVYDVSKFMKNHPGGDFIKQAAGGDVEPFWQKWAYHYQSSKVKDVLNEIRVGTLIDSQEIPQEVNKDVAKKDVLSDEWSYGPEDLYKNDPQRTAEHKVLTHKPFCSETKNEALNKAYLTPNSALYVRNHAPVPIDLELESHELLFLREGVVDDGEMLSFISLQDILKKYKPIHITSVLQCAGNRALEDIKATGKTGFVGTPFEKITSGEVGNILWSGVSLKDVLIDMYPNECKDQTSRKEDKWHVIFEGADEYESSTPLSHILDTKTDCILATKMNGKKLPRDHGYPVRVVLPGIAGARNVKWLQSIKISQEPSKSPWNSHYYRKNDGSHIQEIPLNSMILSPNRGDPISLNLDGCINLEGVAYSGGRGTHIKSVEVSVDNGETWEHSKLLFDEIKKDDSNAFFGWIRFQASVKIPSSRHGTKNSRIVIMCRATDENGVVQPETSKKQRGYLYNGWHKVELKVIYNDPDSKIN